MRCAEPCAAGETRVFAVSRTSAFECSDISEGYEFEDLAEGLATRGGPGCVVSEGIARSRDRAL
jgi:hypothetical protein